MTTPTPAQVEPTPEEIDWAKRIAHPCMESSGRAAIARDVARLLAEHRIALADAVARERERLIKQAEAELASFETWSEAHRHPLERTIEVLRAEPTAFIRRESK